MTNPRRSPEEAFAELLEGTLQEATPSVERMAAMAAALRPPDLPGPDPRFRSRLRNELLAQAAVAEEDLFVGALQGAAVAVPDEIMAMATLVKALEPAGRPEPSPAFRFRLRNHLLEQAAAGRRPVGARVAGRIATINLRMRRSLRAVVATGLAAAMMMTAGAAVAASISAVPGDALFSLKRLREKAQLAVISGPEEGLRLLSFARERLHELHVMADNDVREDARFITGLGLMDEQTIVGTTIVLDHFKAVGDRGPLGQALAFARAQAQDLTVLIDRLPPGARPAALDSLAQVQRVVSRVDEALCGCQSFTPETPSNPLVEAPATDQSDVESSVAVRCACEGPAATTGGPDADGSSGSGDHDGDHVSDDGNDQGNDSGQPEDPKVVDVPDTGTGADDPVDQVEDVIDEIVDGIGESTPTPPPLPLPSPSLPALP